MADIDSMLESHGNSRKRQRVYGKHRGTVFNNVDPQNMGRIQAFVPEVLQAIPTGWAMPCAPVAGIKSGFFNVPPMGSGVWIEFEAGDVSRPIWTGGFWGAPEAPSTSPSPAPPLPTEKVWRSEFGMTISMDDLLQVVTITDALGTNTVTVDVKTGTVKLKGLARVVLDAPLIQEGGDSAFHPGVFGDQLMTYLAQLVTTFNTHMHPGELAGGFLPVTPAPPVAPMTPPTPSLISTKVFLG